MRDTNLPEQNNTSTQQKSKYEQKYEQKARKKVNRKATLALLTASVYAYLRVTYGYCVTDTE